MSFEKVLFFLCFASIGALAFGWWHNHIAISQQQIDKLQAFINAGPRFTAKDGQELCERVAVLEHHSIGFQKSGTISPPCRFYKKP